MFIDRINAFIPQEGDVRHNFNVIGAEFIAFAIALAFMNPNTLLPAFAKELGASTIVVGAVMTVLEFAWNVPQFAAGPIVSGFRHKKTPLMRAILIGRPAVILFALLLWLTGGTPQWLILVMMFVMIIIMFSTDAFAGVAWFDIIGRAFRHNRRPGYMALWHGVSSLVVLAISGLITLLLSENGPPFPFNYVWLFGLAGVSLMISAIFLALIREPDPGPMDSEDENGLGDIIPQLVKTWRADPELRRITLSRFFFAFSLIAAPFYVIYATEVLDLPLSVVGLFVGAQTLGALISSLFLGRIGNRFGAHVSLQVGLAALLTAPLLALLIEWTGLPVLVSAFVWIYVGLGIAQSTSIIGYLNTTIALAPDAKRAVYMGLANSISGLAVISPVIGGWMVAQVGYASVFLVSLVCIGVALVLAITFKAPPLTPEQAVEIVPTPHADMSHPEGI